MSASCFVRGLIEPTEDYKKKYAAFKACEDAGIEIPQQLWEYFNDETPCGDGISTKIPYEKRTDDGNVTYEVDVSKLPPQVTKVQFIIGW